MSPKHVVFYRSLHSVFLETHDGYKAGHVDSEGGWDDERRTRSRA